MIPVGLIVRLVGILMVFVAIGYAVYRVQHWCNTACEQQTLRADTAQAKLEELDRLRIAQEERWTQLTAAEEARAKDRDAKRRVAFVGLVERARTDRATRDIAIPSTSLGVLDDAHAAAEPARPASPPKDAAAPDTRASEVIAWGVEILEWSAECKARVNDWETYYKGLRQ
jgi:hypothetical protein